MNKIISIFLMPLLVFAVKPQNRELEKEKPSIDKPKIEKPKFPRHWGKPPEVQTKDFVKLPGRFGMGSSTLAKWIADNIKKDKENRPNKKKPETENPKKPGEEKPKLPTKPVNLEMPEEIKSAIEEHKSTDKKLKDDFKSQINELGKGASREDIKKLAEKFREDNAELIATQKELGKKIQNWFKDNKPERPKRPEPSIEVKEKIKAVHDKKKVLDVAKRELQEKLKESKDLTKEEKQALIEKFKQENAEKHKALKEAQKELQKKIRETKQEGDRRQ